MASTKLKGITIKLGADTTQLTTALKNVNSNINSTSKELRNINSLLKFDPSNTTLLAQKQQVLNEAIKSTADKLRTLQEAKKQADDTKSIDKNSEAYRELEREIIATQSKLSGFQNEQEKVSKVTDNNTNSLKEFKNAEEEAGKGAIKFGDLVKSNILSDAIRKGFESLVSVTKKLASSFVDLMKTGIEYNAQMEQYKVAFTTLTGSAEKADKIIQQIKKDAASTPFDVEGLTEATQLLVSAGVDSEKTRKTILALGDAISATGGGNEELSRMAVNLQQIKNVGKASALDIKQFAYAGIDVYGLLADYMGVTREEASQMDVTFETLSGALVKASSEGGKYFNAMETQSKTLNGQISNLKDNFGQFAGILAQDTTNAISGKLLPAVNELIQGMSKGMQENGIQGMAQALSEGLVNLLNIVVEMLPSFIEMGITLISSLAQGISSNLDVIISSILTAVLMIINTILDALPEIYDIGLEVIIKLVNGISDQLPTLIPKVVSTLLELFMKLLDPDNSQKITDAGIELIIALADGLIEALPILVEKTPIIIDKLVTKLTDPDMIGKLVVCAARLITELSLGLIKAIPSLLKAKDKIKDSLVKGFLNLSSAFNDIGKNIIKGITEGFAKFDIGSAIKKTCNKMLDGIKSFFGIHSPSRLMQKEVGKFLPMGIAEGFEKEIPNTIKDVQNAMSELNTGIQASVNPTINPQANTNPLIIQIENFNNDRETDIQALAEELEFYRKNSSLAIGGR